jgi:hypothetical protein
VNGNLKAPSSSFTIHSIAPCLYPEYNQPEIIITDPLWRSQAFLRSNVCQYVTKAWLLALTRFGEARLFSGAMFANT